MSRRKVGLIGLAIAAGALAIFSFTGGASGHCDTESGPVAVAARQSLESGDFGPIRIWVGPEQEVELQTAFARSLPVYREGGKGKELAERYFLETAVRLHRAAEGMTYSGLKPAQPLPADVAAAEKALEAGEVKIVARLLKEELDKKLQPLFERAMKARKHRGDSVQAGRDWVDAYVKYVIYVHGLHRSIQAGPAHGVGHPEGDHEGEAADHEG
jgi:hypothetical protein